MPQGHKIATCCYCGTRAALVLRGSARHELSCSSCGAPLHEMKMLRAGSAGERELVAPSPVRETHRAARKHRAPKSAGGWHRPRKRGKSAAKRFLDAAGELFEEIVDLFD